MDLFFLGTGAGLPSKQRNVTSIALRLLAERGAVWLFDCGEATQHQILNAPIKLNKVEKIWLTHLHGDHLFGIPGLLGSRSFHGAESPLEIYGPAGLNSFLDTVISVSGTHLTYPLKIHEVHEGTLFEDPQFQVEARLLQHGIPSYGYRITEKPVPGSLDVDRLHELGVPPGPEYGILKNGGTLLLKDGSLLRGEDVIRAPIPGRTVCILGDTRPCEGALALAKNADVLVHEATYRASDAHLAMAHHHSTAREAAEIAASANCRILILTHISARYQESAAVELLQDAREVFPQTFIADDFSQFPVERSHKKP